MMMEIMIIIRGLDKMTFKSPFQPKFFCDSMTMVEMEMVMMMMMMEGPYLF